MARSESSGGPLSAQGLRAVGIFGGSFDPPHMGHVALVEQALMALDLPEIWVMPAGRPVHRALSGKADAGMRLRWLQRIFSAFERVRVCDWEVRSPHPVATVETLRRIHRDFPDRHPVLLLGADAFAALSTWVDYPEHRKLCDVAVFARTGCRPPGARGWRRLDVRQWQALRAREDYGHMLYIPAQLPDISATRIRSLAAAGRTLAGLVPECVRNEIERMYGEDGQRN